MDETTKWLQVCYEQGEQAILKFIRKALWPTAIVAAALMLLGAMGNVINTDELSDVRSSSGDDVLEAGEEVAIYAVVEPTADTAAAKKPPPRPPPTPPQQRLSSKPKPISGRRSSTLVSLRPIRPPSSTPTASSTPSQQRLSPYSTPTTSAMVSAPS